MNCLPPHSLQQRHHQAVADSKERRSDVRIESHQQKQKQQQQQRRRRSGIVDYSKQRASLANDHADHRSKKRTRQATKNNVSSNRKMVLKIDNNSNSKSNRKSILEQNRRDSVTSLQSFRGMEEKTHKLPSTDHRSPISRGTKKTTAGTATRRRSVLVLSNAPKMPQGLDSTSSSTIMDDTFHTTKSLSYYSMTREAAFRSSSILTFSNRGDSSAAVTTTPLTYASNARLFRSRIRKL